MGWLIAATMLLLIYWTSFGIYAAYNVSGIAVQLRIGPFKGVLYPYSGSKNKKGTVKKNGAEQVKQATAQSQKKSGYSLKDLLSLLQMVFDLLVDLKCKLRMNLLALQINLGGSDPCDLALNYGRTWAAIGSLVPQLERFFVIKKRDIRVSCDFNSSQTEINASVLITITVGRVICLLGYHGFRLLASYLKIINKSKGGAQA